MNWPFVSRARHALLQHNFDEARRLHHEEVGRLGAALQAAHDQLDAERADKRDLLEKYHALRVAGANAVEPHAPVVTSPMADLGPLTRAALAEMANGQSGAVVRAMRNKALALWLELRDHTERDQKVAHAVYRGEALNAT
jgi:hypothetical protein